MLVFILFFSIMLSTKAQNISQAIFNYAEKYSPERAYIHYDKANYSPGDTIWFKTYLLNEVLPANQSKTFYTDFIDDKGVLIQHVISPLVDAVTKGQFEIPVAYKGK